MSYQNTNKIWICIKVSAFIFFYLETLIISRWLVKWTTVRKKIDLIWNFPLRFWKNAKLKWRSNSKQSKYESEKQHWSSTSKCRRHRRSVEKLLWIRLNKLHLISLLSNRSLYCIYVQSFPALQYARIPGKDDFDLLKTCRALHQVFVLCDQRCSGYVTFAKRVIPNLIIDLSFALRLAAIQFVCPSLSNNNQ